MPLMQPGLFQPPDLNGHNIMHRAVAVDESASPMTVRVLSTGEVQVSNNNDTTNYLSVAPNGHLILNGTARVYRDLLPSAVSVGVGSAAPSFTAYNGSLRAYEFPANLLKDMHLQFQMFHEYAEGTDVTAHAHLYVPDNVEGGTVKMGIEWVWTNYGEIELAPVIYTGTLIVPPSNGNRHLKLFLNSGVYSGAGKTISSMFSCRLFRDPTDEADTFNGSVWLKSADLHVRCNSVGSTAPNAK